MDITEERKWCVYIHISPSNKAYIGITSQKPEDRWKNGKGYLNKNKDGKFQQPAIAHAIIKYSNWDEWKHEVLYSNLAKEEAEQIEIDLITLYKSNQSKYGYNIENGGNAPGKISDETRQKLRDKQKGKPSPNKGKKMSDEFKKKMSDLKKGKSTGPCSEETKKKISDTNKGRVVSAESRKKISDAKKENWKDDEYRKNQIEKHKWQNGKDHPWYGRQHSDDTKRKIGASNTKFKVFCLELNKIFDSPEEARRQTGVDSSDIRKVCRGLQQSAGKHPITGEKLHWNFIEKEVTNNDNNVA